MFIVFNLVLLAIAALITYWWANQGAFSALLHLVCVIVAGAVALAFWEPLTNLIMRGSFFDDYAWGVSIVVLFVITLLILRIMLDKVAPANMKFPHWVNIAVGGTAGAAAAVLSIGIFLIGAGHLQTRNELMGFRGWARSPNQAAKIVERTASTFERLLEQLGGLLHDGPLFGRRHLFVGRRLREHAAAAIFLGGGRGE